MNVNRTLLFDPQVAIVDIILIKYAECGTFHGNIDQGAHVTDNFSIITEIWCKSHFALIQNRI